jgi:DNA-directed RNA polymerase specialized sigma24 family protein
MLPHEHPLTPEDETTNLPEERQAIAARLLLAHREAVERLERAGHHLIVAGYNAGLNERRIADVLGCSRTPVRQHLRAAHEAGELRRPWARPKAVDGTERAAS